MGIVSEEEEGEEEGEENISKDAEVREKEQE